MRAQFFRTSLFVGAVAAAAIASAPAQAQQGQVRAGVLTCNVSAGVGLIITSQRTMRCSFAPTRGRREVYVGSVTRFGLDVGVTGRARMVWAVFAPSAGYPRGALAGTYVGASADASVGVGLGANVLVGGFERSIALQPLSVQAQTGINLAVGVAGLELRPGR